MLTMLYYEVHAVIFLHTLPLGGVKTPQLGDDTPLFFQVFQYFFIFLNVNLRFEHVYTPLQFVYTPPPISNS